MTSQCDNCDCADKSQCPYKNEEVLVLDEIVVYAEPPESEDDIDVDIIDNTNSGVADTVSFVLTLNEELARRAGVRLEQLANDNTAQFNIKNPRSYDKAKEIYENYMRNERKKLTQKEIDAINKALEIDEFTRISKELAKMAKAMKLAGYITDGIEFLDAIKHGFEKDDWGKLFDVATAKGITTVVNIGLALIVPVSIPSIIGISLITASTSYFINEEAIYSIRQDLLQ